MGAKNIFFVSKDAIVEWYSTVVLFAICLAYFSNIPSYLHVVHGGLSTMYYYGAVVVAVLFVMLVRFELFFGVFREPMFLWLIAYAVSGVVWVMLFSFSHDVYGRSWQMRVLMLFVFFSVTVLGVFARKKAVGAALFACVVLALITYWHDLLNPFLYAPPEIESSNVGRAAGFFMNANQAGGGIAVASIALMPFLHRALRPWLLVLMLACVFPTFSRSSISFAIVVCALWVALGQLRLGAVFGVVVGLTVLFLLIGQLWFVDIDVGHIDIDRIYERLGFFSNLGQAGDFSAGERRLVAMRALSVFSENPILGIGVGGTTAEVAGAWGYDQSTHNMYLLMLVEQGIVGLLLYVSFIALVLWSGVVLIRTGVPGFVRDAGVALIVMSSYFAFIGFFSHTLLEEAIGLISVAILMAMARRDLPRGGGKHVV